jgi:hypothetical protein
LGTKLKIFSYKFVCSPTDSYLQVAVRRGDMKLVWGDPYMITKEADLNGMTDKSLNVKGTSWISTLEVALKGARQKISEVY